MTVDLAAVAITINTLSTDNVINSAEKGSDLQLSGTTSGVEAGEPSPFCSAAKATPPRLPRAAPGG
ncbi:hypothetical protein ACLB1Q_13080 [Escherichia coli]